ncbi:MAG: LysR family transcriptional regulator [Pseudomonadota bacterium]
MRRDIDVALLRAFVAVVEGGSVTGASRRLNLTQAAVSQQIKRLEELFGAALFTREHRQMRPTPAGEQLLGKARSMLALNDDVWEAMTTPAYEGEVRIGVPDDIVGTFIPAVLKSFDKAWPKVSVSLRCESSPALIQAMDEGELDLTLTTEKDVSARAEPLLRDRLVWIGARNGQAALREPLPLSLGSERCAFRPVMIKALQDAERPWRQVLANKLQEALLATCEADIAVSAYLLSCVPDHIAIIGDDAGLPRLPSFYINLYLPRPAAEPIAEEFARHIRQQFASHWPALRYDQAEAA